MARSQTPGLEGASVRDFSGGINLRDAAGELGENELADGYNITFDERGGVASRLGYTLFNTTVFSGGEIVNVFWSQVLGKLITQAGPSLYLDTTNTARKTFTTSETVTFAELNSLVVACHPTDGLYTSTDGVTWTAVADPDAPKGTCVAVWQSKLFVGCPDGSVRWSDATDPTAWTATSFNKLWEKDQQPIVALHPGSGQDIQGRPGLLCFKQESTYRIDDSATGSYTTVDGTVGAGGPLAVVGVGSRVYAVGKQGVHWWREDQVGMVNASDILRKLWNPAQLDLTSLNSWCAGRQNGRLYVSVRRSGATGNDLAFEHDPDVGWWAPRSDAATSYATSTGTTETLYAGSPAVSGQVLQLNSGGTDNGAAIVGWLQTRWFELNNGYKAQVWQVRVHGRGKGTVTFRTDYAASGGTSRSYDLSSTDVTYDSGLRYDTGVRYAQPVSQSTGQLLSVGVCRQLSLRFDFSANTVYEEPQLLDSGPTPQSGAVAVYGLEWLFVPLGLS